MHIKQIVGLVAGAICIIIGAYLLMTGYKSMNGTTAKIKQKITGSHAPVTRNYMLGGVVFVVVGCGLICFLRCRKT